MWPISLLDIEVEDHPDRDLGVHLALSGSYGIFLCHLSPCPALLTIPVYTTYGNWIRLYKCDVDPALIVDRCLVPGTALDTRGFQYGETVASTDVW